MMNIVKKYMDNNKEFKANVQSLLQTYNKSEIDEEALADVSGQLFGNQEFINNIAQTKLNVFKRIYNEIKYLYHQFTGYKNQDQFVNDLYNKWTETYNSNNKLNNTTKYHISENLSSDIDNVINDIKIRTPIKVRDYTPTALVENGITDLPMYQNPVHIRKNILTEDESKKIGLNIGSRDHYHGLGKERYMKAIDSLDNHRVIFKNKNSKDYIVLTEIKDNNNNVILVPIEIKTQTNVNNTKIDINRIKTVYGHEKINNRDLNDYIKYNIKNNNFEKIYEQKKEQGTGSSTVASSINDSIAPSKPDVNTNTKYSIEGSENNSGSFNLSSKETAQDNSDIRYSKGNQSWREYLEKNFKTEGTITNNLYSSYFSLKYLFNKNVRKYGNV